MSRIGEHLARDTTPCLDDTTIALFVAHRLRPELGVALERHIDECDACRQLLSALARLV